MRFFFWDLRPKSQNLTPHPCHPPFWKFFIRCIEQWTKTFCKKNGRPGRSRTGQPAMILKFTGRVGSRKSWPVPFLLCSVRSSFVCCIIFNKLYLNKLQLRSITNHLVQISRTLATYWMSCKKHKIDLIFLQKEELANNAKTNTTVLLAMDLLASKTALHFNYRFTFCVWTKYSTFV